MTKVEKKLQREINVIETMVKIYCKGNHDHKEGLCSECNELLEYAKLRASKCPFMEEKTFCNNCRVHCYKPEMRAKVKEVMKYAGPRMLFVKPHLVVLHGYYSLKTKIQNKKRK
ncbi:MAG: nitrous oxide-stimulated promoter family protein [bacterium]|nr:nitrous oxide-stimulated promoter family protein [bacterium]